MGMLDNPNSDPITCNSASSYFANTSGSRLPPGRPKRDAREAAHDALSLKAAKESGDNAGGASSDVSRNSTAPCHCAGSGQIDVPAPIKHFETPAYQRTSTVPTP